jgi:hypothetical protein
LVGSGEDLFLAALEKGAADAGKTGDNIPLGRAEYAAVLQTARRGHGYPGRCPGLICGAPLGHRCGSTGAGHGCHVLLGRVWLGAVLLAARVAGSVAGGSVTGAIAAGVDACWSVVGGPDVVGPGSPVQMRLASRDGGLPDFTEGISVQGRISEREEHSDERGAFRRAGSECD